MTANYTCDLWDTEVYGYQEPEAVGYCSSLGHAQTQTTHVRRRGKPATILSLPVEILLLIFHELSSQSRRIPYSIQHFREHIKQPELCTCDHEWLKEDLIARTIFPYSLARVCHHWRSVLSVEPTFWTRIVVSRTSFNHTPPAIFESYLKWSRDLPIEVYVGSVRDQSQWPDEHRLIQLYTKILNPHVHRCRGIDYEVQYSTSLPSVLHDLPGISPLLRHLRLFSKEICPGREAASWTARDDIPMHVTSEVDDDDPSESIELEDLTLDGRNCIELCRYKPSLILNLQHSLLVNNYDWSLKLHPTIDHAGGLHDILFLLEDAEWRLRVHFDNLSFSGTKLPEPPSVHLDLDMLILSNVDRDFVLDIHTLSIFTARTQLTLDRCILAEHCSPHAAGQSCTLRNLDENSLLAFLYDWDGEELTISNSELNDSMLDVLSRMSENGRLLHLPRIKKIVIEDCSHFSLESLKRFVETRHKITFRNSNPTAPSILRVLHVRGAGESISQEDCAWFLSMGIDFQWHSDAADTHPTVGFGLEEEMSDSDAASPTEEFFQNYDIGPSKFPLDDPVTNYDPSVLAPNLIVDWDTVDPGNRPFPDPKNDQFAADLNTFSHIPQPSPPAPQRQEIASVFLGSLSDSLEDSSLFITHTEELPQASMEEVMEEAYLLDDFDLSEVFLVT